MNLRNLADLDVVNDKRPDSVLSISSVGREPPIYTTIWLWMSVSDP